MNETIRNEEYPSDQPLTDTTLYGSRKDDSITDTTERCAITQHTLTIKGTTIPYTARAGHLVTADLYSAQPAAKIFYVAFTANVPDSSVRPVTFFYNGGPGSSSVYLLLGSFGPRRIRTNMPDFTPPAPYALEDNEDSLLDHSDLVFINPVGTGYSAAIAPGKNQDFWGVDEDARCIKQFIRRYLTTYNRWNSPKFLFGESYGTPRTCVLTWFLHEDGIDLNGVVLQSCALDFSQNSNPIGLIPTLAADAWFHKKVTLQPAPSDLPSFMKEVEKFARERYAKARESFPKIDPDTLQYLSDILGIPSVVLKYWKLDPSASSGSIYLASLLLDEGLDVGAFDGRVTAINTGIVASIDPGNKDPTMTAIGGVYTTMWNVYLNQELQYISTSPFINLNDQVFPSWNFAHMDPTGVQKGGIERLYTAGDLAAAMALNPYLKVFSANGYYDAMTPFFRAKLDFENMPLSNAQVRDNIKMHQYPSGHMVYLDNRCRSAMKSDLASFYKDSTVHSLSMTAFKAEERRRAELLRYCRRINRTPY